MYIHNSIEVTPSPSPPRCFSPLNAPPLPIRQSSSPLPTRQSSPLSTLSTASRPPSPTIPNVNLIEPTPDNSQKDEHTLTQLHPTPPNQELDATIVSDDLAAVPLPPQLSQGVSAADTILGPPNDEDQAAASASANLDSGTATPSSPRPTRRTRSKTPAPSLAVQEVSPRRTRSATKSRSTTPRPGSQREPTLD